MTHQGISLPQPSQVHRRECAHFRTATIRQGPPKHTGRDQEGWEIKPHASAKTLPIVEIFDSVQGEGVQAGIPYTFVRFSFCNLACDFCDTPYNRVSIRLTEDQLFATLTEGRNPGHWICFTGGEPMLSLPSSLCGRLKQAGFMLACESNGMVWNESFKQIDHVVISPKHVYDRPGNPISKERIICRDLRAAVEQGEVVIKELRYCIAGEESDIFECGLEKHCETICLSPLFLDHKMPDNWESGQGHTLANCAVDPTSLKRTLELLKKYPDTRLSLQTHKIIGAR